MITNMYPPLQFAREAGKNIGYIYEEVRKLGHSTDDFDELEIMQHMTSSSFMDPSYNGKYLVIDDIARNVITMAMREEAKQFGREMIRQKYFDRDAVVTETRDLMLAPVLMNEWAKNKQVYKLDDDFANALLLTKNLELSRYMVEHLPSNHFYIDLDDCKSFKDTTGIFVHVFPLMHGCNICNYVIHRHQDNLIYFSFYIGRKYDENDLMKYNLEEISDETIRGKRPSSFSYTDYIMDDVDDGIGIRMEQREVDNVPIDRETMGIFALQVIAYLTSSKPDIAENEEMKKVYRKPSVVSKVRNKISEVQMWDVGVTYGRSVQEMWVNNKTVSNNVSNETDEETVKKPHKSPVPHFRCAHWSRYWVGKGRTKMILKWIQPTFVNGKMAKNVTIHNGE